MAENDPSSGSTSSALSAKKFYMVVSIVKRNGISFGANSYQKFVFLDLDLSLLLEGGGAV